MSCSNLIIGDTSQLSRYFPEEYTRISSRNIDVDYLTQHRWNSVYICYAEQRTSLAYSTNAEVQKLFYSANYKSVFSLVNAIKNVCNSIVYFSTAELWNCKNGPISINTPYMYSGNHYTHSKYDISHEFLNKSLYPNVSIAYPFNFNSVYRKNTYLFNKVFGSILRKEKITIGDIHCYRELLHPSMVAKAAISHESIGKDFIIGSGRVAYIHDFVEELYLSMNLKMSDYVTVDESAPVSHYKNHIFYSDTKVDQFSAINVLNKTVKELRGLV